MRATPREEISCRDETDHSRTPLTGRITEQLSRRPGAPPPLNRTRGAREWLNGLSVMAALDIGAGSLAKGRNWVIVRGEQMTESTLVQKLVNRKGDDERLFGGRVSTMTPLRHPQLPGPLG